MPAPPSRRGLVALCLALLAGANLLAYAPSLRAPFVFDDFPNILDNPAVREAGAGRASLLELARPRLHSRRPLAYLSFALNLRRFGLDPLPFHLINLAIHLVNAGLVFALILTICRRSGLEGGDGFSTCPPLIPALAGALFWSLHPVQVQAVTYIVQRMTSGATLLYLFALLLALRARLQTSSVAKVSLGLAAAVAALAGFWCKEILITLPLALLLAELGFSKDPRPRPRSWLLLAALAIAFYLALWIVFGPQLGREIKQYAPRFSATSAQRLLTQPRVICHYLSLLFLPDLSRLNLDPDWTLSTGLLHPWTTAPALLALAVLFSFGIRWIRTRPFPALAWLFFIIALLPESIFPLDPAFEHRLYLPSTALLGLIGAAWVWPGPWPRLRRALFAAAAIFLLTLSFSRNGTWSDDLHLWQDTVRKSPGKPRAWFDLATYLTDVGRYSEAISAGRRSLALEPCAEDVLSNLGGAYLGLHDVAEAKRSFDLALQCDPNYEMAEAGLDLIRTLEANPNLLWPFAPPAGADDLDGAGKLYRRGYSRLRDGRYPEGVRDLEAALKLRPHFPEAASLLAEAKKVPAGPSP